MKQNYHAWNVNIDDFDHLNTENERLHFLLKFGVLAPSAHNIQPWRFSIEHGSILVFLEHTRRLPAGDVNDRQAFISIGCAINVIAIAADYYGYGTTVEYTDRPYEKKFLVAKINITKLSKNTRNRQHLIFSALTRTTNRNKYENKLPPDSFFNEIKSLGDENIQIYFITEKDTRHKISDIALEAMIHAMDQKPFRHELAHLVKNNITSAKVGIPAFGMGIPTPISFIIPKLMKHVNLSKLSKKQDEKLFKSHTPVFCIITTKLDNHISWVKTGEIFMTIALLAEQHTIKIAPWAAPIQIGEFYKNLQEVLKTNFRPQFLMRMGYASKKTPRAPRLSDIDVIK